MNIKHYSYKIKYDEEANVPMIIVAKEGKPSHAEEVGDTIMNSMKIINHSSQKLLEQGNSPTNSPKPS